MTWGYSLHQWPPRLERRHQTGNIHFITFSCHKRSPLLEPDRAKQSFLETLEATRLRYDFEVYGYVVMPEHVHLLLSEPPLKPLSIALAVIKRRSSLAMNTSPLWLPRYHDFNVYRSAAKRIEKLRYIHRDPVACGLCASPEEYPWSSFRHYAFNEATPVCIARLT